MQKQADGLKRRRTSSKDERAIKKLRTAGVELVKLHEDLENAKSQGSGSVRTPDLQEPTHFIESVVLNQQPPPSLSQEQWPHPGVSTHHHYYNSFSHPLTAHNPRILQQPHYPPTYPTHPYPSSSQLTNYNNHSPSFIQHHLPQPFYPPIYYPLTYHPLPYNPPP